MNGSVNKSLHSCVTGQVNSKANEWAAASPVNEHVVTPHTGSMKPQAGQVRMGHSSCVEVKGHPQMSV